MIDLLIGLVLDNADEIIDFGAELLGLGAAAFIVYKVSRVCSTSTSKKT